MYEAVLELVPLMGLGGQVVRRCCGNRITCGRGRENSFQAGSREEQRGLFSFFRTGFHSSESLLEPEIINQILYIAWTMSGSTDKRPSWNPSEWYALWLLMDGEMMAPVKAYPLRELLADVQDGLFSELPLLRNRTIDYHRRRLQRLSGAYQRPC